jgi:NAD(P) transhydrogenase subunit alpha
VPRERASPTRCALVGRFRGRDGGTPGELKENAMLTFIPTGALAAMNAAGSPAQDLTLAQLDIIAAASGGAMHAVTGGAVDPFVFRFSIFVLAIFVGYYVVWSVTPALHTPLMSVTNAISSVIVVGALLAVGVALVANDGGPIWARVLGFVALTFASVNIFGGFLVTQRMLGMYQKKK